MTDEKRIYGVSSGNGNDGVSHIYPDYYVRTDQPWRLAKLGMITKFRKEYQAQALREVIVDGEADYTISATIHEPLTYEPESEGDSYCDANGAAHIVEVFPEKAMRSNKLLYESIEDAFGDEANLVPEKD